MSRRRTTAPRILSVLALAALCAVAAAAGSAAAPATPPIVFPLVGTAQLTQSWGDGRVNGRHAGEDIMSARRAAVVAAEAGRVRWHTTSWRAGCMLYLYGASGTTYLYIHLNNDRTLRNDNQAGCRKGLTYTVADGAKVEAGEQIAWNGDSGDADGNPHLHFEVHPGDGADVDPYPYLQAATRILFPARTGKKTTVAVRGAVLGTGTGFLDVEATWVRWWPNGRWTKIDPFPVRFALPEGVTASTASEISQERGASPLSVQREVRVVSAPAPATPEAMRGTGPTLVAARVSSP
jgi:hypothetical protein